ncbi:MAG: ferrous iron transport protein B [Kiritimatiellae bacterium]|jgi:ferrous iron transport protein B|nr:ferrous iron transport protein B [Kiritimatiellia bacterium]
MRRYKNRQFCKRRQCNHKSGHTISTVAIAGVPNCGKTTIFNAFTGLKQTVGNWPGVTVEKVSGSFWLNNQHVSLVDLPGTYNLSPDTEDQKVAERVISDGEYDLIINVVDASNLSRNLYLTMDLKDSTNQIVVLLNMVDVAEKEGLNVDVNALSKQVGCPVIPVIGVDKASVENARLEIEKIVKHLPKHTKHVSIKEVWDTVRKYAHIDEICASVINDSSHTKKSFTNRIDTIVLNKFAAIPIFLVAMFVTFWLAIGVGSVFIDFFDIIGGLVFVDIPSVILEALHAPQWLVVILAGGVGAGCQTVFTFIPVVFFMFLALAILEDLGYMARVGVIADRFMRKIGLPGSAFIPMIVGFGCTVPAIMAARTLATKRDRFMTIFMAPFMSCGARLPVYALFCAALFKEKSGIAVFMIYLSGLFLAIVTGFFLKGTLFKGKSSYFVMDLPLYHAPRPASILKNAWFRVSAFVRKAGSIVVIAVAVLSIINTVGIKDSRLTFGNEDSQSSILAYVGKAIVPVFKPMGIKEENWPASVALFTGLFAKEAIVGTINSLYASINMTDSTAMPESKEEASINILPEIREAFASIKSSFIDIVSSFDVLGIALIAEDDITISEKIGAEPEVYKHLANNFTPISAFAYLLFVLVYFPCLAVIGVAKQEMGGFYAAVMAAYCTLLAWAVATLFYQVAEGRNIIYMIASFAVLVIIYGGLHFIGKHSRRLEN